MIVFKYVIFSLENNTYFAGYDNLTKNWWEATFFESKESAISEMESLGLFGTYSVMELFYLKRTNDAKIDIDKKACELFKWEHENPKELIDWVKSKGQAFGDHFVLSVLRCGFCPKRLSLKSSGEIVPNGSIIEFSDGHFFIKETK